MLHCHDLMHEDDGMIGWVNTGGGPDNLPLQYQASCDAVRQQAKRKKVNCKGKDKDRGCWLMSNQGIISLLMWLLPVKCIKISQCDIVFVCVIWYAVYIYHVYF